MTKAAMMDMADTVVFNLRMLFYLLNVKPWTLRTVSTAIFRGVSPPTAEA
ncbi:MAG: hypothetical protein ISP41_04925 [Alphaproteobacteria bacterium]|nr:hypothetical protein [Alphaproteobacteria bacterium]